MSELFLHRVCDNVTAGASVTLCNRKYIYDLVNKYYYEGFACFTHTVPNMPNMPNILSNTTETRLGKFSDSACGPLRTRAREGE